MGIAAISFTDKNGLEIVVFPDGEWDNIDFKTAYSEEGMNFISYATKKPSAKSILSKIDIATSVDGKKILRLRETDTYSCCLHPDCKDESDSIYKNLFLQNENNKYLTVKKDKGEFKFKFINYLGRTHLKNSDGENVLDFEIVPRKMDYEEDYIELTKKIAEECSQALLEYSGVTSSNYKLSETGSSKTLLEQFIFLREFCYSQNLQALFGHIKRNPDRKLEKDEVLMNTGLGAPSMGFYTNPFSNSRGWQIINGKPVPQMVTVTRKYDSLDTVANRFVKFALKKFNSICRELCARIDEVKSKKKEQNVYIECYREASEIQRVTDDILRDHFFDDVRELSLMPQNNQVLEKREGYRQIFSAAALVDLALQLNWEGEQEVYKGESKNTALLYEYWLFFELRKIIKSIDGCKCVQADKDPFIKTEHGLTMSLSTCQTSCQAFVFPDLRTKVNLYYNKIFSKEEFSNTKYAGSYSRPFRPDYTLEIYPSRYMNSEDAVREGDVSYIHFDAKYRITDLGLFMDLNDDEMTDDQINDEVEGEKQDSITNTYKRGDLLKMHTYNDAIRRTVGSYVLFPGDFDSKTKNYRLFEEVLPGVGAFSIKPSTQTDSENALKNFITEIIEAHSRTYSRLNRMIAYSNRILREPSISMLDKRISGREKDNKNIHDELCAIGYIRPDYYNLLNNAGLLSLNRSFVFFYYAIKGESVYSHHEDVSKAKYFRFYKNEINNSGRYEIEPIEGIIKSRELVPKKQLDEILTEAGCNDGKERSADFYYVLKVEVEYTDRVRISCKIDELNGFNGNDTFSPHSPKVVTEEWLNHRL